jgi:hypothetical protein
MYTIDNVKSQNATFARPHGIEGYARTRTNDTIEQLQTYYQLYESPATITRLTVYCRAHIKLLFTDQ